MNLISEKDKKIRNYDENSEKIVSQFLQHYFYPSLNPESIEIITDKSRQIQGIDVIININNEIYTIDEKTTVRYLNLPTFSLELSFINRNNIFMANSTLKRLYGLSYDEIKAKYPYLLEEQEQDIVYTIHPDEIGRATYGARKKSNEANNVLNEVINNHEKGLNE